MLSDIPYPSATGDGSMLASCMKYALLQGPKLLIGLCCSHACHTHASRDTSAGSIAMAACMCKCQSLQVSVSGQALVFVVRTLRWSFLDRAGGLIYIAFAVAQVCSLPFSPSVKDTWPVNALRLLAMWSGCKTCP